MRSPIIIAILLSTLLACSTKDTVVKNNGPTERDIVQLWAGKNVAELLDKYGSPDLVINTTLTGRPASEGYVYETSRLAGNPNCINVYVVVIQDKQINDYFCR